MPIRLDLGFYPIPRSLNLPTMKLRRVCCWSLVVYCIHIRGGRVCARAYTRVGDGELPTLKWQRLVDGRQSRALCAPVSKKSAVGRDSARPRFLRDAARSLGASSFPPSSRPPARPLAARPIHSTRFVISRAFAVDVAAPGCQDADSARSPPQRCACSPRAESLIVTRARSRHAIQRAYRRPQQSPSTQC